MPQLRRAAGVLLRGRGIIGSGIPRYSAGDVSCLHTSVIANQCSHWCGDPPVREHHTASPGGVLPQGIEISMISGGDHPIMCSCHRHQAVTEDCARRRVHASNRRSWLLASRRNAGGNVYVSSLSRLLPALNSSPFLFRPGFAGPPSPRGKVYWALPRQRNHRKLNENF